MCVYRMVVQINQQRKMQNESKKENQSDTFQ